MSKPLYSWIIVGISFANIATAYGLRFSFSIFFVAILEQFHWSRACTAGAFSLSALLLGISSWFAGRLVDRFGSRKILVGGVIILSFSTIASGWIQEVWHLYALFGVLAALGGCGLGWVPHSVLLSDWFIQNRGTMVGIAFSGMGAGILVLGPVSQFLISSFGWRIAYMILGSLVLFFLVPLNCMVRNRPSEKDASSIRYCSDATPEVKIERFYNEKNEGGDWTLGRAMGTLPFWCILLAFLLLPLGIFPVIVHQFAYIIDHGYNKILAASIFGAVGFLSSIGRLLFGTLSDRIGREKAVTWSFVCSITGIAILLLIPSLRSVFWLYLYAALFGVGFGARGPIVTAMMADFYHGKHFGSIYGFINIGNGIGGALGPWLAAYLHDVTGSYKISFLTCIPILVGTCILFWIAGWSKRRKKIGQYE
jgi:MFS family permease